MSNKLLVQNVPHNLNQDAFIKLFSDFQGFLNGTLLLNQQNELYGIVEFATYMHADAARKMRFNFKFPGCPHPIIIEFLKNQDSYNSHSGSMNTGQNLSNVSPSLGMNQPVNYSNFPNQPRQINEIEGQNQGNLMQHPQQRFPGDNSQMYNAMSQSPMNAGPMQNPQMGFGNFQGNPNQFNQQGMNNMLPLQNPNMMTNMNPALASHPGFQNAPLDEANRRAFQPMPNNNMNNFPFVPNQQPQFNPMQGGKNNMPFNPNVLPQNQRKPSEQDLVMFKIPSKATSSIYVDGIPIDATEREVAHVFRPFPGFQEVRLIKKEGKGGRKFYLCFADFDSPLQSTIALETLQGYRFSKDSDNGLIISYAFHSQDPDKSHHQDKKHHNNNKPKKRF